MMDVRDIGLGPSGYVDPRQHPTRMWLRMFVHTWWLTTLGGAACGFLVLAPWSWLAPAFSIPLGAVLGAALGVPLGLALATWVVHWADRDGDPDALRTQLSIVGVTLALVANGPLNAMVIVGATGPHATAPWSSALVPTAALVSLAASFFVGRGCALALANLAIERRLWRRRAHHGHATVR